jgi:aminoglycoside 6'-N-acetyltransferase I
MNSIRHIRLEDATVWAALRHDLWAEASVADHAEEIELFFHGKLDEPIAVLVCDSASDGVIGFVELSVRSGVPGCESERVGFVEGLYVRPEWRQSGVARRLLRASQEWARGARCGGFASDRSHGFVVDRRFRPVA